MFQREGAPAAEEEEVEKGDEVTSPAKTTTWKVQKVVYQFNARDRGGSGRGRGRIYEREDNRNR